MSRWIFGFFGLWIYLPFSGLSRRWRRFSRRLRGKQGGLLQQVTLPTVSWRQCTNRRNIEIRESDKANGNIRISELAVIAAIAADCKANTSLLEIGTFDGRTSLNMAFSSPMDCTVYTLDLKPEMATEFSLADGEDHMVNKPKSGARIDAYRQSNPEITNKIKQLYGDSASFDFSPYYGTCSLVFVDGSHAFDYAHSDTLQAIKMVQSGGVIIWHDYGIWEGVTKALEAFEQSNALGIKSIAGTSLAYWKKP